MSHKENTDQKQKSAQNMWRTSRLKSTATDPEYVKSVDRMIEA